MARLSSCNWGGDGEAVYRQFGPMEARLTDDALLRRGSRLLMLVASYTVRLEEADWNMTHLKERLAKVAEEILERWARPDTFSGCYRPHEALTGKALLASAVTAEAQLTDAKADFERIDLKLSDAKQRWLACSAEMVRRFLPATVRAAIVRRGPIAFSLWYGDDDVGHVAGLPGARSVWGESI